jgi:putative membrane protein
LYGNSSRLSGPDRVSSKTGSNRLNCFNGSGGQADQAVGTPELLSKLFHPLSLMKGGFPINTKDSNKGFKQIKTAVVLTLLVIFIIFVLQNTQVVEIEFLFWKMSLSRVILLLGALFIGILAGLFFGWEVTKRKKKDYHT